MKPATLIVLLGLLVLCAAYVLVFHAGVLGPPETDVDTTGGGELFAGEFAAPAGLVIERAGGERIVIGRAGGQWRIAQPVDAAADEHAAGSLADTVAGLTCLRALPADSAETIDESVSGLDRPRWTVSVTDGEGRTRTLEIGNTVPLSDRREVYVRPAGDDRTYVAEASGLIDKLDRPVSEFRSAKVWLLPRDRIAAIDVAGRVRYRLEKADDRWSLTEPVSAPADPQKVRELIGKFAELRARDWFTGDTSDLSPLGLDAESPRLRLTVEIAPPPAATTEPAATQPTATHYEPEKHTLLIGAATGERVYARAPGRTDVFLLQRSIVDALQGEPNDLRSRDVLDVRPERVDRVEVRGTDRPIALARGEDGGWRMIEALEGPADADAVESLVETLADLQASDFADPNAPAEVYGLDEPRATIALRVRGEDREVSLRIGRASPSGEMTFVQAGGSQSVAVVPSSAVAGMLTGPEAYWTRRLLTIPAGGDPLSVSVTQGGRKVVVEKTDQTWRMTAPTQAPADDAQVRRVIAALSDVQATRIVSLGRELPERARQADQRLTVLVAVPEKGPATATAPTTQPAGEPTLYTLHVARVGGAVWAWTDDDANVVGEVPADLYAVLADELRDRTVLQFDPDAVARIAVAAGDSRPTFERADDGWRYAPDPYVKIDGDKIAEWLGGVAGLKAHRFVTYTETDPKTHGLDAPAIAVTLTGRDGEASVIRVSSDGPDDGGRYAAGSDVDGVFVLPASDVEKLSLPLDAVKAE